MILVPRPMAVTQRVGQFLDSALSKAAQYENVTFAIDESTAYDLHELAAAIYADGFNDGTNSERERQHSGRIIAKYLRADS